VEEDEKQKTLEERVAKVSEKFTARRKGLSEGVVIPDESKENMYMQMYGEAVSPWHSLKEATNTEDKMANLVGRSVVKQWLSMDTDIWARASISLGASVRLVSAGISFYDDEKVERKRMRAKRILGELRL
jgi:hypothetical protein